MSAQPVPTNLEPFHHVGLVEQPSSIPIPPQISINEDGQFRFSHASQAIANPPGASRGSPGVTITKMPLLRPAPSFGIFPETFNRRESSSSNDEERIRDYVLKKKSGQIDPSIASTTGSLKRRPSIENIESQSRRDDFHQISESSSSNPELQNRVRIQVKLK